MTTGGALLRFEVAEDHYAFEVDKTREVLTAARITPLPHAPAFLTGVINLRGSVIPVVDLRAKLGHPPAGPGCPIVILGVENAGEPHVIGAQVDGVRGVFDGEGTLVPPPRFGMALDAGLVRAIAQKNGDFVVVLDADRLFSEEELWKPGPGVKP